MTLGDVVGHDRDGLVACAALIEIEKQIIKGTMETDVPIDFIEAHSEYERYIASGLTAPTVKEIAVGAVFVNAAFPHIRLTAKGSASVAFIKSTYGAGFG